MDSNLLKEAIADAKAVRQTALANAKVALQENFDNKFNAMFAQKLKEDAGMSNLSNEEQVTGQVADENVSEGEIDELIKELEQQTGPEAPPEPTDASTPPVDAAPDTDAAPTGGLPPEETPVAPKGYVLVPKSAELAALNPGTGEVLSGAEDGAGTPPAEGPEVTGADASGDVDAGAPPSDVPASDEDDNINLDELLESLKTEIECDDDADDEKDCKTIEEDKKLASSGIGGKVGGSDNKKPASGASSSSRIESGGAKKDGYPSGDAKQTAKDPTDAKRPNEGKNATSTNQSTPSLGGQSGPALKASRPNCGGEFENTAKLNEENIALKKQLNEAEIAVKYVKGQLNEINLLNAKLLYTNKLFKNYSMNNTQKMRIVEMFDLSNSVREVKLTYTNLNETLSFSGNDIKRKIVTPTNSNAQSITEGLASKPVASTKPSREIISESRSAMVTQFQKLAGIKTK